MFRLYPNSPLGADLLRRAGRFASPEGEEGAKGADGKPAEKPGDGAKPDGGKPADGAKPEEKPSDTVSRITTLVDERNAARQEAADFRSKLEAAQQQLQQLQSNDQSKVVTDLQKKLTDLQTAQTTRFDKLLEVELAQLPDAAQKAVKAIPGGSEAQFDWLAANRALFQGASETKKGKGPDGQPSNDKKPAKGDEPGASSVAKGYVEARKPKKAGFPGLTG